MKTCKWLFLLPIIAAVLISCGDTSEEELVGNWKFGAFGGGQRMYASYFTIGDKGYVCCGFNGNNVRLRDVWEYSNTGQIGWRQMADIEPVAFIARQQAVAFSLNGKGYVGTGKGYDLVKKEDVILKDFWEFDPAGNGGKGSWREVAPLPDDARERHSAIGFSLTVGGKQYGYVGTGFTDGASKLTLTDFWQYTPPTDGVGLGEWTSIPAFNGSKRYGGTVFVIDEKAYICTGKSPSGAVTDLWVFDPNGAAAGTAQLWTEKRRMYPANPDEDYDDDYLDLQRAYASSFVMNAWGGMKGYITVGGKYSTWEYDPVNDLWVKRTSFYSNAQTSTREGAIAFSFLSTNQAFVGTGGVGGTQTTYDDFREFFPEQDDITYDDNP